MSVIDRDSTEAKVTDPHKRYIRTRLLPKNWQDPTQKHPFLYHRLSFDALNSHNKLVNFTISYEICHFSNP